MLSSTMHKQFVEKIIQCKNKLATYWNVTPLFGDFEGRVGIYRFLQSPPIPRRLPSLFFCRELFSFCHFNSVLARLQARGLARGTAMSAGTWVKCKKYVV